MITPPDVRSPPEETYPRICLVTPSFNQAPFLEATLTSVLSQGYPNLDYIVIDGGSTDGSVEILRRYETRLAALVIEPDRGHAHALNKGFARSTGEIMGWINSDDLLLPGSLSLVGELFRLYPDMEWLTSAGCVLDPAGRIVAPLEPTAWNRAKFLSTDDHRIQQESTFWRRTLWERAGGALSEDFLACDFELWARFFRHARLFQTRGLIGAFRHQPGQRSVRHRQRYTEEARAILHRELAHPENWTLTDEESELVSLIRYEENSWQYQRTESDAVAWYMDAVRFLRIDSALRSNLLILEPRLPPWRLETTDWIEGLFPDHPQAGEKGVHFYWMGSGESEGFAFTLLGQRPQRVRLRLRIAPGPSRPGVASTLAIHRHAGAEREIMLRKTFAAPEAVEFELDLGPGAERFSLSIAERETVVELAPGESRRLLAGLSDFCIEPV